MTSGDRFFGRIQARFVVALICLFAFTFQTYVVQTHIHGAGEARVSSEVPANHKAPVDKDSPDDCPICQAYALTGSLITPAIIIFGIAITWVKAPSALPPSETVSPFLARNWRSRAPPQH
jgi:hypothetical protein